MKNVLDILLANVDAEQLMAVIVRVGETAPHDVISAFNEILGSSNEAVSISPDGATVTKVGRCDLETVESLMKANKKVAAIKFLRDCTGWGLKETKDYVEHHYTPKLVADPPDVGNFS